MKEIQATMRLLDASEKPLQQHVVDLQMFTTKTRKWGQIGQTSTDTSGLATFKIDATTLEIGDVAPLLRLVEQGGPGDRILASGGMVQFNARTQILSVDFGEIERLDDSAFPITASTNRNSDDILAGVPHKPGLSQGTVLHNLTVDRSLGTLLSATRRDPGTISLVTGDGTATAANTTLTAELTTLRAQTIEKDRLILRKDQDLAQRAADLAAARREAEATNVKLADQIKLNRDALERISQLEATPAAAEVKSADIQTVFTQIGTKMGDTNTVLKAQATPFRLSTIKIDLRGPMTEDGRILLGEAAVQNGSGVSVELQADPPRDATETQVRVPEVTGLTESAVRRVLRSVGLRLKSATQTSLPGKGTPGQALTQHPAAGQSATHGAEILVVFAALTRA